MKEKYDGWIVLHMKAVGEVYPAKIAKELDIPPQTVHRVLERLEKINYVRRRNIGPIKLYELTEAGRKYAEEFSRIPGVLALYRACLGDEKR